MKRIIIVLMVALTLIMALGCKAVDYKVDTSKQNINEVSVENEKEYTSNYYKVTSIDESGIQCNDLYSKGGYYLNKQDSGTIDLRNIKLNDEIEIQLYNKDMNSNKENDDIKNIVIVKSEYQDYTSNYFIATSVTDTGLELKSIDSRLNDCNVYLDKAELNYIDLSGIAEGDKVEWQIWNKDKMVDNHSWKDIVVVR